MRNKKLVRLIITIVIVILLFPSNNTHAARWDMYSYGTVTWGQQALNDLTGANISVDGAVGPQTSNATRGFQQIYSEYYSSISIDGQLGPETYAAMQIAYKDPIACFDSVSSNSPGEITVNGWVFDWSDPTRSSYVDIYIGGPAGSSNAEVHRNVLANIARTDVDNAYHCGAYHGLSATISTSKTGSQPVYVYGVDVGGDGKNMIARGNNPQNVSIGKKTVIPSISISCDSISSTPSTKVNDVAEFSIYLNKPPVFDVSVSNASKKYYAFESKAYYLNSDLAKLNWTEFSSGTLTSPTTDGQYILYVKAVSSSGDTVYASSYEGYTIDTTPPLIGIESSNGSRINLSEDITRDFDIKSTITASIVISDANIGNTLVYEGTYLRRSFTSKSDIISPSDTTYEIISTDKAGNSSTGYVNILQLPDSSGYNYSMMYTAKSIDLNTLTQSGDLFYIDPNAGALSFSDATFDKTSTGNYSVSISGVRGQGTLSGTTLTVKQAGTFAIKAHTAKNGMYAENDTIALLTVNKAIRSFEARLMDENGIKREFSQNEAAHITDYISMLFPEGNAPDDKYITYNFYEKGGSVPLSFAPTATGDYELEVYINDDGVYNASVSDRIPFSIVPTNSLTINYESSKGNVTVTDSTGKLYSSSDLKNIQKDTILTLKALPSDTYSFNCWKNLSGITLKDTSVSTITITVSSDIKISADFIGNMEKAVITLENSTIEYTGNAIKPVIASVKLGSKSLKSGVDYSVHFSEYIKANSYSFYLEGMGDYSGKAYSHFTITPKKLSTTMLSSITSYTYSGKEIKPAFVVNDTISGTTTALRYGLDYTYSYSDNVNVGTASVIVAGKGNYSGTAKRTFSISPKRLTSSMVTWKDVSSIKPTMVDELIKSIADPDIKDANGNPTALKEHQDYTKSITYVNSTVTITISGMGNYTSQVSSKKYSIQNTTLTSSNIKAISDQRYTGKEICPNVVVISGNTTLKKGTDYDVSYESNTNIGTATIIVKGRGNYTGICRKNFNIISPLSYRAYVQKNGWMRWTSSGIAGTTSNLRMETIQMKMPGTNASTGGIRYRAYVQKKNWTQWADTAKSTTYAGTKGQSLRIEAIQIKAWGTVATAFDVYYRAYSDSFGWLGWAKNGASAGTAGYAYKLRAFEVKLLKKGEAAPTGSGKKAYIKK